jgi:beta-galactosidase/beta-glucuronidase
MKRFFCTSLVAVFVALLASPAIADPPVVDSWRYTLRRPDAKWQSPGFDDSAWTEGEGGFGTTDTPGARVGTAWQTNQIFARKTFSLDAIPQNVGLWMHHDEDAVVFLNGQKVLEVSGFDTQYKLYPIDEKAKPALKIGTNVLAVRCTQTTGGQFIDVHVVDADNLPTLPPAKRNLKPVQSDLITKWGENVTAENAWTQYPRPQMARDQWTNLNGMWNYAVASDKQVDAPEKWDGQILVPFSLESKLGGVERLLFDDESLWYQRSFTATPGQSTRTRLHFEAVDYRCEVFINGQSVGSHRGGNDPFSFDITDQLSDGENTLTVRVEDDTEGFQLNGKQSVSPRGIWYTQVSGIWQTVWMEQVPADSIAELDITTDAGNGSISIVARIDGSADGKQLRVEVLDGDRSIATADGDLDGVTISVPDAKLWSPTSPHLYALKVSLMAADGSVADQVESYAGIRSVAKTRDADGHLRFTLNGETIFHWGPLDQGWWPDGLLTPPSDEAMLFDIQFLKEAGFNMIRKHIKVEPRRYYYHCDRIGMMVWQDQVSGGPRPPWTRLNPDPVDAQWPDQPHQQFMLEFERMIDSLENHPSIVVWTPFNEAWGQHRTVEVGKWTVDRDPTRLVNIASGGNFWPVGDIVDEHRYPHPGFPFDETRYSDFIKVVGEFGGHGYPVQGHLWDADRRNWGYGGLPENEAEYKQRYVTSIEMLNELRKQGIAAGVYTQTTDVEGEINGLMTYDRKAIKIPAKELNQLHQRLFQD